MTNEDVELLTLVSQPKFDISGMRDQQTHQPRRMKKCAQPDNKVTDSNTMRPLAATKKGKTTDDTDTDGFSCVIRVICGPSF